MKYAVLWALCIAHLLNDTFQSVIPAVFPLLKENLALSFFTVGLISTVFQLSSSVFQPLVGWYTDKHPQPYALPCGMSSTLAGIILLAYAGNFSLVLIAVTFIGFGSAILHPEASRLAYMASGGRLGFAQSIFQVGGNTGSALGPLLAFAVIFVYGHGKQESIVWFGLLAAAAVIWMVPLSRWHAKQLVRSKERTEKDKTKETGDTATAAVSVPVLGTIIVLLTLIFSKNLYTVSLSNFLTFYLIEKYRVSVPHSQLFLFAFLFAVAAGTLVGGPIGDRYGRRRVIWFSILGAAPFTLLMPYIDSLWGTCVLSMCAGAVMASSFPAIIIYAQELVPGKIGTIGGLFFGFSFGAGAIASALLGVLADWRSIEFVYEVCAYLPLIGLITWFLPQVKSGSCR
ncbi:MAG: MFS transporter [Planctomycetaceae bacterium]|jgi:FSR family fosmidomycin resistance protein-like MFS transporter|nr:MFS transporter [Planctomycetaceae bacterium]